MRKSTTVLVPVTINGLQVRIDPNSIPKEARTVHHGVFKDTQVNSPATCQIGDSVILWPDAGNRTAIAIGKADLGVLATQFLKSEGLSVLMD